jgi:hypothetical protein
MAKALESDDLSSRVQIFVAAHDVNRLTEVSRTAKLFVFMKMRELVTIDLACMISSSFTIKITNHAALTDSKNWAFRFPYLFT